VVDAPWYALAYTRVKRLPAAHQNVLSRPMTPYFFGYGSLVNRATHTYPNARPAQLQGWRRAWVRTPSRDVVFLSVVNDLKTTIDGLIAAVPGADWAALDAREHGYARLSSGTAVNHDMIPKPEIAHYAVAPESTCTGGDHVILLSYLDVVVQGFVQEFGEAGVSRFFATTSGWKTPVLNDRATPRYPRAQVLTPQETALVDHHLAAASADIVAHRQHPRDVQQSAGHRDTPLPKRDMNDGT
jgi:hypothetical protein